MTKLQFADGTEATLDPTGNELWSCDNLGVVDALNLLFPWPDDPSIGDQEVYLANKSVGRFGGKILLKTSREFIEGKVY